MSEYRVKKVPVDFIGYDWDDDFKLIMFCLEFTRNEMSAKTTAFDDELKEWGFTREQVYDNLWSRFKYYKGKKFNNQFAVLQSNVTCPYCHKEVSMAEFWPQKFLMEAALRRIEELGK